MARNSGKQYQAARKQVEAKEYLLEEAVPLLKKIKYAKFDETVEIHMRLGVDPKHADQMVRGTVVMPNGLGKSKKVLVIASGDKQREATEAGADLVGGEDMVNKIQSESWTDFDAVIATPDMMRSVGKLGKVLGPRGLMPNPKTGTVTVDVAKAIREIKAGKVEFRVDKTGIIHAPVGKVSFDAGKLVENAASLISAVMKKKADKQKDIDALRQDLEQSRNLFVTGYEKLKVGQDFELRKAVRGAGGKYRVVKNNLAEVASAGTPAEQVLKDLRGMTSVAYTASDPVALAKALTAYAKLNPTFTFKAGLVEGRVIDIKSINDLAAMPSKEEIFAKLLYVINAPAQRLATVIATVGRNLAVVIDQGVKENKFGAEPGQGDFPGAGALA